MNHPQQNAARLLGFPIWLAPVADAGGAQARAGDWFVVAHLGFFFLLLACFGWAAWGIWRRTTRPAPHLRLLMEIEAEERQARQNSAQSILGSGHEAPAEHPWERPGDWWKGSHSGGGANQSQRDS